MIKCKVAQHIEKTPRLARVFRATGGFRCGVCGKAYKKPSDAWQCLSENLNHSSNIAASFLQNTLKFRCLICGKAFLYREGALGCANKDLKTIPYPHKIKEQIQQLIAGSAPEHPFYPRKLPLTAKDNKANSSTSKIQGLEKKKMKNDTFSSRETQPEPAQEERAKDPLEHINLEEYVTGQFDETEK